MRVKDPIHWVWQRTPKTSLFSPPVPFSLSTSSPSPTFRTSCSIYATLLLTFPPSNSLGSTMLLSWHLHSPEAHSLPTSRIVFSSWFRSKYAGFLSSDDLSSAHFLITRFPLFFYPGSKLRMRRCGVITTYPYRPGHRELQRDQDCTLSNRPFPTITIRCIWSCTIVFPASFTTRLWSPGSFIHELAQLLHPWFSPNPPRWFVYSLPARPPACSIRALAAYGWIVLPLAWIL
jgi:hypothetical protein